ncbi:MAG: hypothetical protein JF597_25790 [Streptomyces sp.]|jgi:hypothetical protein|uniref:hypothetical protein n=1 Tax=Streptomyces sp. TaxID=1931 RepID=UPI0025EC9083|nr:hypothetical protein [Streptomyces sp.]MBW8796885.1 hypothetical protein [Streptomyces sp.]
MTPDTENTIRTHAVTLNGQTAAVNLIGGQTLTGTLAYATTPYANGIVYPDFLQITVSTKVHTVRMDHVSSIGQG